MKDQASCERSLAQEGCELSEPEAVATGRMLNLRSAQTPGTEISSCNRQFELNVWPVATAPGSDRKISEIETYSQTNLTRAKGACGHEKCIQEILTLHIGCGRSKRVKVYEFTAEAEDRFVKYIVKLDRGTKTHLLAQTKLARDIQIKEKLSRSVAR